MIRNPEGSIPQGMEQTHESAARKAGGIHLPQTRAQSKYVTEKKCSYKIIMLQMQKNKARED
jgi:hypothetical protein